MKSSYFYGMEAEQFKFFRIPKILFTSPKFKRLSDSAKLLYGLMLDRMGLSIKNGWMDDQNRAYIYYTVDEVMEQLDCASQKATKLIAELDTVKGVGLIERVKQGQGKPAKIYLKKFTETESQDFSNSKAETFESNNSDDLENTNSDFPKSKCNNTEYNNTDFSEINLINHTESDGLMGLYQRTVNKIKEQIDYDGLLHIHDKDVVDNIVNVIADVMLLDNDY